MEQNNEKRDWKHKRQKKAMEEIQKIDSVKLTNNQLKDRQYE
jgi:hypothetical protein